MLIIGVTVLVEGGGLGVGSAPVGKRLWRWLGGLATSAGDRDLPEPLPALPAVDWLRVAFAGGDSGVSAAEVAPALLAVARDGDEAIRRAAVDALAAAEAQWWLALDEALRHRWWWVPRWSRVTAAALADGAGLDLLRLVVAGCHPDGHLREAAVAYLAGQNHPAAVAVVALRASDWVVQVRDRARMVSARWFSAPPDGVALVMAAQMALALRARREGGWLAAQVERALRDLALPALEPLLSARDRRTRRAAYRAGIAAGRLGVDRLMATAARDPDVPIRDLCARAVIATSADLSQVRELLTSPTALVRAEALRAVTASGAVGAATTALTDRHRLVRAVAQEAVCRGGADPAAHYRRLMAPSPPAPAVIAGLGETGGANDAALVRPWLSHPRARGRVEAIRALRRWGAVRPVDLVALLHDDSAAVTRQAAMTLRPRAGDLDQHLLHALVGSGNPPHVRFAGYRLLIAGDAWQRLATNLRLVDDPDLRLRATARADIATWLDREAATTYRGPGAGQADELDQLIEQARPVLGAHRADVLRFHAGLATRTAS
jgi:hypothetical protein